MKLVTYVSEEKYRLGALLEAAGGQVLVDLNRLDARLPATADPAALARIAPSRAVDCATPR